MIRRSSSPYYFASLNCGREFQVFVQRLDLLEQKVGDADIMSPIIPLFWENEDYCWRHANAEAREFLESFQLPVRGFPNDYPSVGLLRQLLLGKPNTYDEICFYLADRIKELAEREPPLPALEGINDFRKLPSAFDPGQKEDKPLEPAITPVLNLDEMQPPPGVAAAPAPSSLHLAQ